MTRGRVKNNVTCMSLRIFSSIHFTCVTLTAINKLQNSVCWVVAQRQLVESYYGAKMTCRRRRLREFPRLAREHVSKNYRDEEVSIRKSGGSSSGYPRMPDRPGRHGRLGTSLGVTVKGGEHGSARRGSWTFGRRDGYGGWHRPCFAVLAIRSTVRKIVITLTK